jgi:membrane protease YdiL (CAAX protease family)
MSYQQKELTPAVNRDQIRFAFTVTIGSMLIGGVLGALLLISLMGDSLANQSLPKWGLVFSEIFILIPMLWWLRKKSLPLAETLRLTRITPEILRDAFAIGLGLSVIIDEVDRLVALVFPMPDELIRSLEFLVSDSPAEIFLLVLGAVILAPFIEELVFRGFFQRQLEQGYQDITKAVMISAAMFMILHFNPWWSLQIYLLGLALGYLAWRCGSIWPAVAVHAINNGLALITINLDGTDQAWYTMGGHVSPIWLLLAVGLTYVGFRSLIANTPEPVISATIIFERSESAEGK